MRLGDVIAALTPVVILGLYLGGAYLYERYCGGNWR
jgi:hypothetical protein